MLLMQVGPITQEEITVLLMPVLQLLAVIISMEELKVLVHTSL